MKYAFYRLRDITAGFWATLGGIAVALGLASCARTGTRAATASSTAIPAVSLHRIAVDGVDVFYREAGPSDAPVILLLHGFPSSSHMFRDLMPRLAGKYHVIAPDLPGFGFTNVPAERHYRYTFDALATTIGGFVDAIGLQKYALYIFDYGAPVGLRLAVAHPERVTALISQNGNAYEEGLGDAWAPIRRYWANPSAENREAVRQAVLGYAGTRAQYVEGTDANKVAPESYTLDAALLERPGQTDLQLDLFLDYQNNLKLYPTFQKFFRDYQPPTLAIWGSRDPIFIPAGAAAYRKDNPKAIVKLLDAGHFAIETNVDDIAGAIDELLRR